MGEFCSEVKLTTKCFLNKHIPYWSLDVRPYGKLGESNKKRGIFRLGDNPPISLHTVSLGPKYYWF